MKGLKKAGKFTLRMVISAAILAWLLSRMDLDAVFSAFSRIPLPSWAGAFGLYLASQVLSSVRWFVICRTLGFGGRFTMYLKFYFVGMYFNLFLPSAIGGDVLKAFFLSRHGNSKLKATYSIFADRLFGLWALFLIGAAASFLAPGEVPGKWRHIVAIIALSMTAGALAVPFLVRGAGFVAGKTAKERPAVARLLSWLRHMAVFWRHPSSLLAALGLSTLLQIFGMTGAYLLGLGLGIGLGYGFYLTVLPLIAVLTVLPISFSGIGVREGGFLFFFHMAGVPMEKAVALGLSVFAIQAMAALIGGIGYLAGVHKQAVDHEMKEGLGRMAQR